MNWWNFTSNVPLDYKSSVYFLERWPSFQIDQTSAKLLLIAYYHDHLFSFLYIYHSFSKSTNFRAFFFMSVTLVLVQTEIHDIIWIIGMSSFTWSNASSSVMTWDWVVRLFSLMCCLRRSKAGCWGKRSSQSLF